MTEEEYLSSSMHAVGTMPRGSAPALDAYFMLKRYVATKPDLSGEELAMFVGIGAQLYHYSHLMRLLETEAANCPKEDERDKEDTGHALH